MTARRVAQLPQTGMSRMFEAARRTPGVIRLEMGDPELDTPPHVVQAMTQALAAGYTHYTPMAGLVELQEAVAHKVAAENGIEIDPHSQVVVTAGATSALYLAFLATINPGDEVLLPTPCWPQYVPMIELAGGRAAFYPLRPEWDFRLDLDALRAAISPRTRMVLVCSPGNPTGTVLSREEMVAIARLAAERDLLIISDEPYEHLVYDGAQHTSIGSLAEGQGRTITVYSCSKSYTMTGWRMGYAVGPAPVIGAMSRLQSYTHGCANAAVQRAAIAALTASAEYVAWLVAEYQRRRDCLLEGLLSIPGVRCVRPQGAFYAFPDISAFGRPATDFAGYLLAAARVAIVPGDAFGGPNGAGHVRMCFARPVTELEEAVRRMKDALGRWA